MSDTLSYVSGALTYVSWANKLFLTSKKRPDKARTGKTEAGYEGIYCKIIKSHEQILVLFLQLASSTDYNNIIAVFKQLVLI